LRTLLTLIRSAVHALRHLVPSGFFVGFKIRVRFGGFGGRIGHIDWFIRTGLRHTLCAFFHQVPTAFFGQGIYRGISAPIAHARTTRILDNIKDIFGAGPAFFLGFSPIFLGLISLAGIW